MKAWKLTPLKRPGGQETWRPGEWEAEHSECGRAALDKVRAASHSHTVHSLMRGGDFISVKWEATEEF